LHDVLLSQYIRKEAIVPITSGDIVRVTVRFKSTLSGDIVNVFHMRCEATGTNTDANLMDDIDAHMNSLYSGMAAQLNSVSDPYDIRYDLVELVGGVEHVVRNIGTRTWTLTSPPAQSGDTIPPQDAAIVNMRTTLPKVFGRKYLGPFGEGNTGNGTFNASALTALANFGIALLATYNGTNFDLFKGVLSSKATGDPNLFATFVGYVVNALSGTQRRRRINRGS
jgi:hypothetical protein